MHTEVYIRVSTGEEYAIVTNPEGDVVNMFPIGTIVDTSSLEAINYELTPEDFESEDTVVSSN